MRCRHSHEYTCSLGTGWKGRVQQCRATANTAGEKQQCHRPSSLFPPPADHHASFHGDAAFSSLEDGPGHRSRMCDADFLQGSIFLDLKGFIGFERFLFFVVVYFYIFLYISSLGSWISGTTKKKKKNFSVERPVGFGVFPVNCAN